MLKLARFIILFLACLPYLAVNAAELPDVGMQAIKVSDHVWYVKGMAGTAIENEGFVSNAAFVITGDGVVVFDALGNPALAELLLIEIHKLTKEPIKMLI